MVSNDVLGIRGRWCMVWFDVDIQIHRGTGIGWITTKGCRAAEVFQGEPGHEPVLRDHLMHQVLVDQWTWTRHQQNQLFHASAAGSSTTAQPTMPAWKDSWQSFGCVFLLKFSPWSCVGGNQRKQFLSS